MLSLFIAIFLSFVSACAASAEDSRGVISRPLEDFSPYLWSGFGENPGIAGFQKIFDAQDPLRAFLTIFPLLLESEKTKNRNGDADLRRALDYMLDKYEPADRAVNGIQWLYGYAYEGIPANWSSAMDGFLGPLTLYAAWELFGEDRYRTEAIRSIKRQLKSPNEGGTLWRDGDRCWLSEYAWKDMSPADEFYVLNGHLYALQALFLLAQATQERDLSEAYACAKRGYFAIENRFEMSGGAWTHYQLHPTSINPLHYLLFEISQFRVMQRLDGDPAWARGAELRAKIFEKHYPLEFSSDQSRVTFSRIGAPYPYWIDSYTTTITCKVGNRSFSRSGDTLFIDVPVPAKPDSCEVSMIRLPSRHFLIYSTRDIVTKNKPRSDTTKPEASYGASPNEGGGFEIVRVPGAPGRNPVNEGRFRFSFPKGTGNSDIIALTVETDAELKAGFLMEGADGSMWHCDYTNIPAGKPHIVMVHRLGFKGIKTDSPGVAVTLRLYVPDGLDRVNVRVSEATVLSSKNSIRNYIDSRKQAAFILQ